MLKVKFNSLNYHVLQSRQFSTKHKHAKNQLSTTPDHNRIKTGKLFFFYAVLAFLLQSTNHGAACYDIRLRDAQCGPKIHQYSTHLMKLIPFNNSAKRGSTLILMHGAENHVKYLRSKSTRFHCELHIHCSSSFSYNTILMSSFVSLFIENLKF